MTTEKRGGGGGCERRFYVFSLCGLSSCGGLKLRNKPPIAQVKGGRKFESCDMFADSGF